MKKKIFSSILIILLMTSMLFIITGCGDDNSEKDSKKEETEKIEKDEENKKEEIEEEKAKIEEEKKKSVALEDYFDKDVNKIAIELSLKDVGATSATEYSNDEIIISASMSDSIDYISLMSGKKYSIYGVKIGMSLADAKKALEANGYMNDHGDNNKGSYYIDGKGNSLKILSDSDYNVVSVSAWKYQ